MPTPQRGHHGLVPPPHGRALRAAVAMSAAVAVVVGAAPPAHGTPTSTPSDHVSRVSMPADSTDPDAEAAAIELLKATYFNDVDTKNWGALRQLFTPDAVVDTTGSFGPLFPNRDSFIAFTALTLSAINTRHQGYDPQIELTSDTTAGAEWTMQDRLSLAGLVTIHGFGHYTDSYERVDGQWRVTYSKLTRTGFTLEFPALQAFATGLAEAYKTGGAAAALRYVVPAIVNIPIGAAKALVGAIASNFGGPPAKAEPITVPPGSTGVTTEPPGVVSSAAIPPKTAVTFAVQTPARKVSTSAPAEHTTSAAPATQPDPVPAVPKAATTDTTAVSRPGTANDSAAPVTQSVSKNTKAAQHGDNEEKAEVGSGGTPAPRHESPKSTSASHDDTGAAATRDNDDAGHERTDTAKSESHRGQGR